MRDCWLQNLKRHVGSRVLEAVSEYTDAAKKIEAALEKELQLLREYVSVAVWTSSITLYRKVLSAN